jgi:GNAT superfamily N-acetyltransferase
VLVAWDGRAELRSTTVTSSLPVLRLAKPEDTPAISALMKASVRSEFPKLHNARQTESAAAYISRLDPVLIDDGTYFVHEANSALVACGGWSKRGKLFADGAAADDDLRLLDPATEPARIRAMFTHGDWTRRGLGRAILQAGERAAAEAGFRSLILMATLPGAPLYRAYGFTEVDHRDIVMPNGVCTAGILMTRPIQLD